MTKKKLDTWMHLRKPVKIGHFKQIIQPFINWSFWPVKNGQNNPIFWLFWPIITGKNDQF